MTRKPVKAKSTKASNKNRPKSSASQNKSRNNIEPTNPSAVKSTDYK